MSIADAGKAVATGIAGLDDILFGGLTPDRVYLLQGAPGSGKTTLSLQFLLEGLRAGERTLYVTLSETRQELLAVAQSHGLSLEGMDMAELIADEQDVDADQQYTMFQPSEVELGVTTRKILDEVDRIKPKRVVIDSLSEIKLLAQTTLRFRRQVLALKQCFAGRGCTVLFLDDKTSFDVEDQQLESIVHGVIVLQHLSPEYGAERRRLRVTKLRGRKYRGGYHDFSILTGGLKVFPRVVAAEHAAVSEQTVLQSGVAELDSLLCGGIDGGTSSLLIGPAGSGKSTLGAQYACHAAAQGHASIIFAFEERVETMLMRADGTGSPLRRYVEAGLIEIRAVDPAEISPGQFGDEIRVAAENGHGVKLVIIDSLNGYLHAMPEERFLVAQLHEILTFLGHRGVTTFLLVSQSGLLGAGMTSPLDASYLADNVILFRHFEIRGELRKLISVVKKRSGRHERTLREFEITAAGIRVGQPLHHFRGVLTGTPFFENSLAELRAKDTAS
jgi:circadian clock protein KaiC